MRPRTLDPRLEQPQPRAVQHIDDLGRGLSRVPRDVVDRARDVQQILAGELLLRIDRRVAARLDAESQLDDRGVGAEQRVDLVGAPQIERAFGLVRVGSPACSGGTLSASSAE